MFILLRTLTRIRRQTSLNSGSPRWLAIRHVDAGSCNGCEHELGAVTNPLHDLQRHGLDIVASPRHADILLITGPVTTRMAGPLQIAYNAMPDPRLVAALGDCALGCNLLGQAQELAGPLTDMLPVDIYIPGCPPTPDTIAEHLLDAIRKNTRQHPPRTQQKRLFARPRSSPRPQA
ncbi:MAG: NADH-quinone oxidoreductase subunit B family protein [Solirubrobacteraceae bacterium]